MAHLSFSSSVLFVFIRLSNKFLEQNEYGSTFSMLKHRKMDYPTAEHWASANKVIKSVLKTHLTIQENPNFIWNTTFYSLCIAHRILKLKNHIESVNRYDVNNFDKFNINRKIMFKIEMRVQSRENIQFYIRWC